MNELKWGPPETNIPTTQQIIILLLIIIIIIIIYTFRLDSLLYLPIKVKEPQLNATKPQITTITNKILINPYLSI
jgi:hypothetical protein